MSFDANIFFFLSDWIKGKLKKTGGERVSPPLIADKKKRFSNPNTIHGQKSAGS